MCRQQQEEEEHRQQLGSLRVAQERLEGRLRQEEEAKTIAEGEIARQKACIGSMRAEASELECALHRAHAEVPFMLVYFFTSTLVIGVWACGYTAVQLLMPSDARACLSFYVGHLDADTASDSTAHCCNAKMLWKGIVWLEV